MKQILTIILYLTIYQIVFAQNDSTKIEYKRFFYQNGKISSEGYMKEDVPIGYWKSYYITGVLKSEGKWNNNKLDSVWIFYDQLGDTTEKINYYLGKKSGYQFKYYQTENDKNKVYSKELYINRKRNGVSYYFYVNGKIRKEIPYENHKKQGIGYEYDNNENIITITRYRNNEIIINETINRYNKEGKREGTWKEFYKNGKVKEEKNYLDGKLNGLFKIYNEEGKLLETLYYKNGQVDLSGEEYEIDVNIKEDYDEYGNLLFQGSFKNEKPVGTHRWFDDKGNVIKSKTYNIYGNLIAEGIVLLNGKEDGDWIYYHNNGKIKAKGTFSKGNKNKKWTYYYDNGNVQQVGNYSNGKYSGNWKWYYKTRELLKEEFYLYGNLDGEVIEYSEIGDIISKGNYIEGYKEGEWTYIIGDQKHIGKYVMGQKDGKWKSFYIESNNLSFEGYYLQGMPNGKHIYYYPNELEKEERYYDAGIKVKSWTKYDEFGKIILVVQYKNGKEYRINGQKVNLTEQ